MTVENESVHALTGAYVLDALDPDEQAAFEQHLAVCADCREEVRSLRSAVVRLPALSAVTPPAELRASVLSAIKGVRPRPPLPEQGTGTRVELPARAEASSGDAVDLGVARERRDRRANRWRLVAAAAAVVGLAGVGWGIARPGDVPSREAVAVERPADGQMLELLAAPDLQVYPASADGTGAHGTVLRSESLGVAAVLLQGLPALTGGDVFQAWTLEGDTPASAGVFTSADGGAMIMLDGDVTAADAVAVTVEPTGGSPSPTGEMVFHVAVS